MQTILLSYKMIIIIHGQDFYAEVMNYEVINMRILIVEDEVQLSEALGVILEKNNYIVNRVFDGKMVQIIYCLIYMIQ